jgi:predicted nucleic acid-binding protein
MALALLDSSCWVELFTLGNLAGQIESEIKGQQLLVPTSVIFEVYRKICRLLGEESGMEVVAAMSQHEVLNFDRDVALLAADLSIQHRLGMADSIVYAHAVAKRAPLVTMDNDFAGIAGAKVLRTE